MKLLSLLKDAVSRDDPNQIRTLLENHVPISQSPDETLQQTVSYCCIGTNTLSRRNELDINAIISDQGALLHWAADRGYSNLVSVLLIRGADINTKYGIVSMTPLMCAAIKGRDAVVVQLLNALAIHPEHIDSLIMIKNNTGCTVLHYAASGGHEAVVEQLLNALAAQPERMHSLISIQDNDRRTAFHYAAAFGHEVVIAQLLNTLATRPELMHSLISMQNNDGNTPLHLAASHGYDAIVAQLLNALATQPERMYSLITARDDDGWTAFHYAASEGHEAVVAQLLNALEVNLKCVYSIVSIQNNDGNTPLHLAASHGYDAVITQLLNALATQPERMHSLISAQDNDGRTALCYACINSRTEVVKVLLEHYEGALDKITSSISLSSARLPSTCTDFASLADRKGKALELAITHDSVEIITLLAKFGANLDVSDWRGDTPLHRAARDGRSAVVIALIENGAKTQSNKAGKTPHDVAQSLTSEALSLLEECAQRTILK